VAYVIFIRGVPGSGKTTLSEHLSSKINGIVIDPDFTALKDPEFQKTVQENTEEGRLKKLKYRHNLKKAKEILETGTHVIWTQPWRKISGLEKTERALSSLKPNFIYADMDTSIDLCWKRTRRKHGNITKRNYIEKYVNRQEPFLNFSKQRVKIDGTGSLDKESDKIACFIV
jgi:predicted kinase